MHKSITAEIDRLSIVVRDVDIQLSQKMILHISKLWMNMKHYIQQIG